MLSPLDTGQVDVWGWLIDFYNCKVQFSFHRAQNAQSHKVGTSGWENTGKPM